MADKFTFVVVVHTSGLPFTTAVSESGETPIGEVARRVVASMGVPPGGALVLLHGDRRIPPERTVGRVFEGVGPEGLILHVLFVPWEVNLPALPEPFSESETTAPAFYDEAIEAEEDFDLEAPLSDADIDLARRDEAPAAPALEDEFPTIEAQATPMPPPSVAARRSDQPAAPARAGSKPALKGKAATVQRRATVRYYNRMNPEKVFPLLVILSEQRIKEIVQKRVEQKETGPFAVEKDSFVAVKPILPGCTCYPSKAVFLIGSAEDTLPFWVVPHVKGRVKGARVEVRQDGKYLASIPLDIKVRRQTMAVVFSLFTLAMPLLSSLARHFKIDFSSQKEQGFALYYQAWEFLLQQLAPVALAAALAVVTAGFYLWARPRRRDQFWDVDRAD